MNPWVGLESKTLVSHLQTDGRKERLRLSEKGEKTMSRASQGQQLNLYRPRLKGCAGFSAQINANLVYTNCRLSLSYITIHTTINILFSNQSNYSSIFPVHMAGKDFTALKHNAALPRSQLHLWFITLVRRQKFTTPVEL